jgi:hypothetical protein
VRLAVETLPGDSQDAIAGDLERCVADPITLEGGPRVVVSAAIELDHETLPWPDGVNQEALHEPPRRP